MIGQFVVVAGDGDLFFKQSQRGERVRFGDTVGWGNGKKGEPFLPASIHRSYQSWLREHIPVHYVKYNIC